MPPVYATPITRAIELNLEASRLIGAARTTCIAVAANRQTSAWRRLLGLARGGIDTDGAPLRSRWLQDSHCPNCDGKRIKPLGRVVADRGEVRADYRCLACDEEFVLVIRARLDDPHRP